MNSEQPVSGVLKSFDLSERVAVITGAAGLLGQQHAEALSEAGATCILCDVRREAAEDVAARLRGSGAKVTALELDVTSPASVRRGFEDIIARHGRLDILVNNAARNPKVEDGGLTATRFETMSLERWEQDLAVDLRGAFLCCQTMGSYMARCRRGVIVNIASDLALIAPDQRLYRVPGKPEDEQPVKPVTYSVTKGGLLGLTRYLATYWADHNVRVNALCPAGVFNGQPEAFVARLSQLIPMGRMARRDEYKAALVFLASDAASYMTGATLVMDGGRTCW